MDKDKSQNFDKPYQLSTLKEYGLGKRLQIRAIARAAHWAIALFGDTISTEVKGWEHYDAVIAAGKQPIFAMWHDRIFLGTYFLRNRKIVAMISQSFDGEYIARTIQLQGNGAVRGSSTRGGVKGLVEMIRIAKQGAPMCLIVDGPKGPRYEAKEGAVLLAKKTGAPLLPFSVEAKSFWQMEKSWDKMHVPKPFTTAKVFLSAPIYVSAQATDAEIAAKRLELQTALERLADEGKKWRSQ